MKKEDLLKSEFLKQFRSGQELNNFLDQLQKRGIEQLLEGEMDDHLGYNKHDRSQTNNARNGHSTKTIKTKNGKTEINVPRDRDASYSPLLIPKRKSMVEGIENVIVSLYAKGMSVSDIEEQIREVYNFEISTSTISRITDRITQDIMAWQNRAISVNEHTPSITRSRTACPVAGDSPKPTPDIEATVTLSGAVNRSRIGRPSGVFSTTPAHERITFRCAALGNISATRRAKLRINGEPGRAAGPSGVMPIHSCGPPPNARLPRKVWRP